MKPTVPAANPEPYREPRTGIGAALRNRTLRRVVGAAALLGLIALADQSIVRTQSSPLCLICSAAFDETRWTLDVPFVGLTVPITVNSSPHGTSAAAEFLGPGHTHALFLPSTSGTRGILVERTRHGPECCPASVPGAFTNALYAEPTFAAFVHAAIERGDVARDDVAAAIEIGCGLEEPGAPIPDEERRVRDVANGLYAAWRGIPVAEADLWGAPDGE